MFFFTSQAKSFIFFFCIYMLGSLSQSNAQVFIEKSDAAFGGNPPSYMVYGSGGLSNRIPYDKIKGSPFWSDEYKLAVLYLANNRAALHQVKLNLATNEIYFLKNDEELVLENVDVIELIFYKGQDTSEIITSFTRRVPHLILGNKKNNDFVQIMNQGKYQLLKHTKRIVDNADSLFGTQKKYFFKDELKYFLKINDKVERIRKLNEEYILSLVPSASNYKGWIKERNINFKKEEDVIRFLNYYNSLAFSTPIK